MQVAEVVQDVVEGVLVGLLPRGRAQLGDQKVDLRGARDVRVLLQGTSEGAQGVGELNGQARVLIEKGLDEGEGLDGVRVLAEVVGQVRQGLGRGGDGVRSECGHRAPWDGASGQWRVRAPPAWV
ncbi:hypothetical protein [Streptomyces coerulescens]|uniref:Uncharacterized protein n=1 Tax=Streptomyces coerulescens TaxID=29304 RepID=A0ABW0CV06_STRCD